MADDIDIEEHDLLDNPRIQDILHIKEEPIDIDHRYEEPDPTYDEYNQYDYYHENHEGLTDDQIPEYDQEPPDDRPDHDQQSDELDKEDSLFNDQELQNADSPFNDQDLENADSISNNQDLEYNSDTDLNALEDTEYVPDLSNEIYHHKNKIILGTKPCKRPTRDVKGAYVSLEDWGVRLQNSNCYCKECQTLFATQNALDAHNMVAHSFLVALDSPMSSESDSAAMEKSETAKFCDHCKKYFPSDHALIQHLYDLITANKQTPVAQATVSNDCTNAATQMLYSCLVCNLVYKDIKWANSHTLTVHNKPGHFEYVSFTGACKFCNYNNSTLKLFNWHVKDMHLPGILKLENVKANGQRNAESRSGNDGSQSNDEESQKKNSKSMSIVKGPTVKATKVKNFKCTKCKKFFSSIKSIRNHQSLVHKGEKVIQKVVSKSLMSNVQKVTTSPIKVSQNIVEVKSPGKFQFVDNLVPKNSIFKCNECSIHFVTCWSAILHSCVENMSRYQCDICEKQFRLKDTNTHMNQHKYNDAFNTYYISKNMINKMLFWCQNCAVYFELKKIQNHMKICNGTSTSVRCKLCEVDVNDVLTHMNNHKIHPTKSDFIFIDDLLPDSENERIVPEKDLKRKLPTPSEPGPSKIKKSDSNHKKKRFFYCEKCQACMKIPSSACHETGECKKIKMKSNCEFCGLVFFSGGGSISHREFHRKTNAKLQDFIFINISDRKPIVPVIPEFPKCETCNVHDFASHQCGTYKSCKTCNKNFSESAYKLHLLHHKYLKVDTEVTALIKKYETLPSTWNIIYLCKTCNVATDSYDYVVLHCQNHYNDIVDCSTRNCDSCSLKLEESCFKRHKELHSPSITKASFKTVEYDFKNLLNDDWLKLFGTLSKAEVHQIVNRSIYVTRFVRMKLILDGPPELTIYKCETCKLYVDPQSIYNHTTSCSTLQGYDKKYPCNKCLVPFSTAHALKDHEKLHASPNITANSFRIVAFNDRSDRKFNSNLQVDLEASEFKPKTPIKVHPSSNIKIAKTGLESAVFYQCRQCDCCSLDAGSLIRHKCLTKDELLKCKICQLHIDSANSKEHRKWHKQNPNISRDNFKTVLINNNTLKRKQESREETKKQSLYKLHQCKKCKICYSYWVHHPMCSKNRRLCKKCGLLFSYGHYEFHNMWHLQHVDATRNNIRIVPLAEENSRKNKAEKRMFLESLKIDKNVLEDRPVPSQIAVKQLTLYQCYNCKLCSYIKAFVKKHTVCAGHNKGVGRCYICDLKFKFIGMKFHKAWHKEHADVGRKDIKIIPFKGTKILKPKDKKIDSSNSIVANSDGYECKKCGAVSKKTIFLNKHKCSASPASSQQEQSKSQFLYYQCEDCEACLTSKRHYCMPAHRIRSCPRCKLKFSNKSIYAHMQNHAKYKNMTRSKITVIPFKKSVEETKPDTSIKPVKKVSTVFKCSCGLHFISQKTIERHFTVCSPDHSIPSENCSKCGLLFPTNHLVSHLCNHHSYGKGNIEVKTIPTITYYRCGSCKCLFVDKTRLLNHNERCDVSKVRSVRCEECDLDFHNTEIRLHKETHNLSSDSSKPCRIFTMNNNKKHASKDETMEDVSETSKVDVSSYDVEIENEEKSNISPSEEYDNNLYKCNGCKTHFLKLITCASHVWKNQCPPKKRFSCTYCGFIFTKLSLKKHIAVQHKIMKLKPEDFVIKALDSELKIDLFKCHICSAHFLKAANLRNHVTSGIHDAPKTNCPKCDIPFAQDDLETHIAMHHRRINLKVNNFNVIEGPKHEIAKTREVQVPDKSDKTLPEELNVTQDGIAEPKETTVIENESEHPIYYNCVKCDINFTSSKTLEMHIQGKHIKKTVEKCQLCGLSFITLAKHNEDHQRKNSGLFLIQDVTDETDSVKKLFKCKECGQHFTRANYLIHHITNVHTGVDEGENLTRGHNCPDCGLLFSYRTLKLHQTLHHVENSFRLEDLIIDESIGKYRTFKYGSDDKMDPQSSWEIIPEVDKSTEKDESPDKNRLEVNPTNKSPNCPTKLYKCGKCNVYFLTQATCYKHSIKHIPMDPKEYIECKLCSFQFRIVSLNTHIRKHHKTDFAFDKILIEEYHPKMDNEKFPKIDIYYAKDKVQSRLVSTTTTDDSVDNSVSQSEIDLDPEASDDSRETVIITNTDNIETSTDVNSESNNKTKNEFSYVLEARDDSKCTNITSNPNTKTNVANKNVMVKIPSFSVDVEASYDSNENSDNVETKTNLDSVKEENVSFEDASSEKTNEAGQKVNEVKDNLNVMPSNAESSKARYPCGYCTERFGSRIAKDFHENLDHLDTLKDCPICKKNFHASVLSGLHLSIKNDFFTCCVCDISANVDMIPHHAYIHKHIL